MAFRVGQKVASQKADEWFDDDTWSVVPGPRLDEVCTVRGFDGHGGLLLNEFRPGINYPSGGEKGYAKGFFVPLVERETDISALTALLVPGTKILEGV